MDQEYTCRNHPDRKALSFCFQCREYYCFDCLKEGPEHYFCNRRECQKALEQEQNPPELEMTPSDSPETLPEGLIEISRFRNPIEANIALTKLESEGIESFLFDEHMNRTGLYPPAAIDIGFRGVKLMVRESEAQRASHLLEDPIE
jgi:hypothetical protein